VLPRAAKVRVQTTLNGVISTELRPTDGYAFTDTNCASSMVTDFCETNLYVKLSNQSECVCPLQGTLNY
jgi:hypothetical protein